MLKGFADGRGFEFRISREASRVAKASKAAKTVPFKGVFLHVVDGREVCASSD